MRKALLTLALILLPCTCLAGEYTVIITKVMETYKAQPVAVQQPVVVQRPTILPRKTVTRTYTLPTYYYYPQRTYYTPQRTYYTQQCWTCQSASECTRLEPHGLFWGVAFGRVQNTLAG